MPSLQFHNVYLEEFYVEDSYERHLIIEVALYEFFFNLAFGLNIQAKKRNSTTVNKCIYVRKC